MSGETGGWYRRFGEVEARGSSGLYELWALGIADDPKVLGLIGRLPWEKRQPNLVLGAARFLGVGDVSYGEFREWVVRNWDAVVGVVMSRRTQTNEVGRAAVLLPVLAGLAGPLALIEVGASAGLCLYPDRFSYRYEGWGGIDPEGGASEVRLRCGIGGEPPIPERLPEVVWRAGVDLNPLDVNDFEQMRWLEALVWPGQPERVRRLRGAIAIARTDPAHLVTGDLNETVAELVSAAPDGATVVVMHSAVLGYLSAEERVQFERTVQGLGCHWVSNEGCGVIGSVAERLPVPAAETPGRFVVALDGVPLAYAGAHGQWLDWFAAGSGRCG
ncbi:DUF2332 domain-containing protein [Nocardia yamanashiensis]|uniref:DUF2332 domain-containing protein n=1 Tax=Nocardia yamanashiensis TaxID=209247 RepID=UPI0008348286|nr:DUF2332 domain-containing protein [Nocardia yamanashiensis]